MLRAILIVVLVCSAGAQLIQRQKLRFKLSARGLPDKDNIGTTDPYVEIFYTENGSDKETKLGRTSTISDTENPNWGDIFEFDFDRSKGQRLQFKVKDHDNAREDDTVGKAWVIVDDFVDKGQTYTVNLSKKGTLTIQSSEPVTQQVQQVPQIVQVQQPQVIQPAQPQTVYVQQPQVVPAVIQARKLRYQLSARGLPDTDIVGTTDPYVKIFSTDNTRTSETLIGRTAPIADDENPNFKEILEFDYIPGTNQKWRFLVLDDDNNRRDDEVGTALISVDDYVNGGENTVLNLSKGQLIVKRA